MILKRDVIYSPHDDFFIEEKHDTSGYSMPTFHMHKKYELYFQKTGNRKYFIEDSSYIIHAGDLVIIDKDEIHKTVSLNTEPYTRIVINFNAEYLEKLDTLFGSFNPLDFFTCGVKVVSFLGNDLAKLLGYFETLLELETHSSRSSKIMRRLVLAELLIFIRRNVNIRQTSSSNNRLVSSSLINKISLYISQNYRQELTLSKIAEMHYITPTYLCRLFKKTTSLTLTEYINSVRIKAAKTLLESSTMKITEITSECGFGSSSQFARSFKKSTGFSPQEYRRKYKLIDDYNSPHLKI